MSQYPHDEFFKEYCYELCQDYGITISSADVKSERRQVDILFTPSKELSSDANYLGWLAKMLESSCILESYRNAVQSQEIRECLSKLFDLQKSKIREAKKEETKKNLELPQLWLITPTISANILAEFRAMPADGWPQGFYFLGEGFRSGIVAVHQLPVNPDTLWLRILGRGRVQTSAVEELLALPSNYPHREMVLELIYGLWDTLSKQRQNSPQLDTEEQEAMMSLRSIFHERLAQEKQEGMEQGIQQGIQQGMQQTLKSNIISILEKRFETVPSQLVNLINDMSDVSRLQTLLTATIDVNSLEEFENLISN